MPEQDNDPQGLLEAAGRHPGWEFLYMRPGHYQAVYGIADVTALGGATLQIWIDGQSVPALEAQVATAAAAMERAGIRKGAL